ncbi:MAG: hypothetical protein E7C36_17425, partial [Mixta calida]|nr:hypothetical protein [Mixta calida]
AGSPLPSSAAAEAGAASFSIVPGRRLSSFALTFHSQLHPAFQTSFVSFFTLFTLKTPETCLKVKAN